MGDVRLGSAASPFSDWELPFAHVNLDVGVLLIILYTLKNNNPYNLLGTASHNITGRLAGITGAKAAAERTCHVPGQNH